MESMKNCSQVKHGDSKTKKKKRDKKRNILGRHLSQKEKREKKEGVTELKVLQKYYCLIAFFLLFLKIDIILIPLYLYYNF